MPAPAWPDTTRRQNAPAEIACAVPNLPVLKAARALHAQGKRLYYISDMYLPKVQLDAMLAKCGYDFFDGGFVSADYGVQKRSGKLFRLFLQKTQTQAKEVLFIGDNWRADVAGSALAGIRSWHLPTQEVPRESLPAGAVAAFTANRLPGIESEAERLGFATLGPLAVAYCQWLHAWEQQHPNAKIYFLARDMYLMRQVYALLYPQEQTAYLQVSRRSLCPLLLAQHRWDLLLAALPRQSLTGAQIAAYCGTACPMDLQEKSYDLKHGPDTARPLLQALATPQSAAAVSAYLTRQNLQAGDILVDIGSGGTTQMLLQAVCNIKLHGCQLSCDDRLRGRLREDETAVFLFDGRPAPLLYWAGQPMLERLISEDVGATLGYTQTDKTITVQQASQPPTPLLDALQKGNPALCAGLAKVVSASPRYPAADCHLAFSATGRPAYGRGDRPAGRPDRRGRRRLPAGHARARSVIISPTQTRPSRTSPLPGGRSAF